MQEMPPKGPREGRALGAGEAARLITLFSNDRIICYGSFDSSLIFSLSLSLSLCSHLPETRAARRQQPRRTTGASSNVVKYQSVVGREPTANKSGCPRGDMPFRPSRPCSCRVFKESSTPPFFFFFFSWELKKWYYRRSRGSVT